MQHIYEYPCSNGFMEKRKFRSENAEGTEKLMKALPFKRYPQWETSFSKTDDKILASAV